MISLYYFFALYILYHFWIMQANALILLAMLSSVYVVAVALGITFGGAYTILTSTGLG